MKRNFNVNSNYSDGRDIVDDNHSHEVPEINDNNDNIAPEVEREVPVITLVKISESDKTKILPHMLWMFTLQIDFQSPARKYAVIIPGSDLFKSNKLVYSNGNAFLGVWWQQALAPLLTTGCHGVWDVRALSQVITFIIFREVLKSSHKLGYF